MMQPVGALAVLWRQRTKDCSTDGQPKMARTIQVAVAGQATDPDLRCSCSLPDRGLGLAS